MKNKVFIITGCSSGLGWELALQLNALGVKVAGIARRDENLQKLTGIVTNPDHLLTIKGDITIDSDCQKLIDATIQKFGQIDGIIVNAGISMKGHTLDLGLDLYRKTMETNYFAAINLIQKAYVHIQKQSGHIIIIGSLLGLIPFPYRAGYVASKHALISWAETLKIELKGQNIGVHFMTVFCGYMRTEISGKSLTNDPSLIKGNSEGSQKGSDPKVVASKIIKGIEKCKTTLYPIKTNEKILFCLNKLSPLLIEKIYLSKQTLK